MATVFPNEIQTFPNMIDIQPTDGSLVNQYQTAMEAGNLTEAQAILVQIPEYQNKFVNADLLNTINDTVEAMQQYFADKYSPAYIVSSTQPLGQNPTDFWFEITDEVTSS